MAIHALSRTRHIFSLFLLANEGKREESAVAKKRILVCGGGGGLRKEGEDFEMRR